MTATQKVGAVAIGVGLWFIFIFVVRYIPWAFDGGVRSLTLFLLTIPLTWSFVVLSKRALSLTPPVLFEAIAFATMPALLLDGLVFTFASQWYGFSEEHIRNGAGFIFWGAGMGMVIAWFMHVQASRRQEHDTL